MSNNISHNTATLNPNNPGYLKRPHLHNLLKESLQKPVTTIVAGAGYGKTQAVYAFLQEYDAITIWLQLSIFDNLKTRLWENFIYAISLQNEELASNLTLLGFPETMEGYNRFLVLFSNAVKRDKKYILVYDDCHLIHEKHVKQFFERFINARIPNLSVIFISRNEPDINTVGLLAKGLITNINEDDLRFSKSEMIQYFQMQDIQLSPKAIIDIYRYTDGWAFAIHLVGLSMKKGAVHENYALSAAKANISRLMETDIFSTISEELQNFLVKMSLLENLPFELIKELSSDNPLLITEMTKISTFIRYDAFINTYRIHQLFLSFLIEKQDTLKADDKIEVYSKSANWYAKNGYKIDALNYYEKIQQYDEILKIIMTYYCNYECLKETAQFIIELLDRAPKNLYIEKPIIQVIYAKFLLNNFQFEDALLESSRLIEKFESMPQTEENKTILGELYIILGLNNFFQCLYTGEYDFQRYFKMADEYLPNGSTMVGNNFYLNQGNYACSVSKPIEGEFDRFINAICYAMPYATKVMNNIGLGTEYLCLTEKSYYQRDLKSAKKYAYHAISKSQEHCQHDVESLALFYLVKINVYFGDYSKIISLLDQLRLLVEKYNSSICYRILDITEGWFYSMIGQSHKVAEWITNDVRGVASPSAFGFDRLIRARCYLAEQRYYELLAYLEKHEDNYGIDVYLLGRIEKKVVKAVALYQLKEIELSFITLQEAYNLAHSNFIEMPFIEHGSNMRTLTNAIINNKECAIPIEWLKNINIKSSTYAKKCSHIIAEYKMSNSLEDINNFNLTKHELEILTDLCHGLTREEIAINCNLSVNTVKSMLQNIYAKLGAANTLDAVHIATMMNLVK